MKKVVECKNVSFAYGDKPVLKNINLSINANEYVSILGHNGSGKSTLAKLLLGLNACDSGEIYINDQLLSEEHIDDIRQNIGIVFQNPDNQFIGCFVRDDIAFGLENHQVDPNRMDAIIEQVAEYVEMEQFLDHEPSKLSGGQKQRVAIAGVLAMNLNIIVLDEATSMLDPKGRVLINDLVSKLRNDFGMSVISITHDIEEAMHSDRVIVLKEGKIIGDGEPGMILSDDQLIKSSSLEKPLVYQVQDLLQKNGIEFPVSDNLEGVVERLCQLNSNK